MSESKRLNVFRNRNVSLFSVFSLLSLQDCAMGSKTRCARTERPGTWDGSSGTVFGTGKEFLVCQMG